MFLGLFERCVLRKDVQKEIKKSKKIPTIIAGCCLLLVVSEKVNAKKPLRPRNNSFFLKTSFFFGLFFCLFFVTYSTIE